MNAANFLKTPNYHDLLIAMLHDPDKHDELHLLLSELLRIAPKETRDRFPERVKLFFSFRCTKLARLRMEEVNSDRIDKGLIFDGVDRIIGSVIGTSTFVYYTRRAYFAFGDPSESVAESARVLGASRQAVYRAVEQVEAELEKLPEVHGKPDDGVIAARLWRDALERVFQHTEGEVTSDKLWKSHRIHVSAEENDRRVREAWRIFEAAELERMRLMSPAAKSRAEAKVITKIHTLEGQLAALRSGGSEAMAAE